MTQFAPANVPLIGLDPTAAVSDVGGLSGLIGANRTTAALQNALNSGGNIRIDTPGVYTINKTLSLPSNTTLNIGAGVTLRRDTNVNAPLLKNKYCAYIVPGTRFTRSNNIVTVTDYGHTFAAGDLVYLPRDSSRWTDTSFGGYVTVLSASVNTWTYASVGADGTGGNSNKFVAVIPIVRSISVANVAAVTVNSVNYLQFTDSVGDLRVGTQLYMATNNTADTGFIGLVDVAVVTPTGFVVKTPGGTAGVPFGDVVLNYHIGGGLSGEGAIDGNQANQSGGSATNGIISLSPVMLSNVSYFRINNGVKVSGSLARAVNLNNPSNVYLDVTVDDCKVGVQIEASAKKVYVNRVIGASQQNTAWNGSATKQANDDLFALTATKYTGDGTGGAQNYDNTTSPFALGNFDVYGDTLEAYNALNGLKITGDTSATFDRVLFQSIKMTGLDPNPTGFGQAISIVDDGVHLTGTKFNSVRVNQIIWDWDTSNTLNSGQRNLTINATGACGELVIGDVKYQTSMAGGVFFDMTTGSMSNFAIRDSINTATQNSASALYQFNSGTLNSLLIENLYAVASSNTTGYVVQTGTSFTCPNMSFKNLTYSAVTNNSGAPVMRLDGVHAHVSCQGWRPVSLSANAPIALIRNQNTSSAQTITYNFTDCTLKGANLFGDNGSVIGATNLTYMFSNCTLLTSGGTNLWNFSGSATTQINILGGENNSFPTSQLITVGPNVRLNAPCFANLSALAGKFTGQVNGDRCISTTAVNGLPTANIRVEWDSVNSKWRSVEPVASGSATLVAGTVTVSQALMQSTSEVRIRNRTTGGTPGAILPVTYTASTNFVFTSTSGTDTSTLLWDLYGTN